MAFDPFAEDIKQAPFDPFADDTAKPEKPGMARSIADLGLGFASGAVGATKTIADAAGANNATSRTLQSIDSGINSYLSPSALANQQKQTAIQKEAEGKGVWEGVKAGGRAFAVAPVQTAVTGLGSVVPIVAGMAATALTGGGAAVPFVAGAGMGAAMGAGTVKGTIYDDVKQRGLAAGMSEADADAAAIKAQDYNGKNSGNIAIGAGLGAADSMTGVTKIAVGMLKNAIVKPVVGAAVAGSTRGLVGRIGTGLVGEIPLEAAQGGQERYSSNVAAGREGYAVDPMAGVASQATLEGLASAGPGAAFGAMHKAHPSTPAVVPPSPTTQPATLPPAGPMSNAVNIGIQTGATSLPTPVPVQEPSGFGQMNELADLIGSERSDIEARRSGLPLVQPPSAPPEPSPTGSFSQMNELADLVSSEQADVQTRRQRIGDVQGMQAASQFETQQARVSDRQATDSAKARYELLQQTADSLPEGQNLSRAFGRALQENGYTNTQFSQDEVASIANFNNISRTPAQTQATAQVPDVIQSAPNEMDAEALGIREKGKRKEVARNTKDAFQRLAELELIDEQRPLLPDEENEVRSLLAQIDAQPAEQATAPANTGTSGKAQSPSLTYPSQPTSLGRQAQQSTALPIPSFQQPTGTSNESVEKAPVAQQAEAQGPEQQSSAPVAQEPVKSYPKGRATAMAAKLTRDGFPTEAYPHPSGDGSFALRKSGEETAPIVNSAPKAEAPAESSAQKRKTKSPIMQRDDIVGAIMRATGGDGIASGMAMTLTGDTANNATKLRGLFTNTGQQDMDDLAMLLRENEGYDVKDGNHLSELIREASSGNYAKSMARTAQDKADEKEKQHRDLIRQKAAKLGVKTAFVEFSKVEEAVLKITEQRHKKAISLLDDRSLAKFNSAIANAENILSEDVIDATLTDVHGRGLHGRSFWDESTKILRGMIRDAELEKVNDAINNAVEGANPYDEEVGDGRGNQPVGGGRVADSGDQAQPGEAFGLEGQTLAEVNRQEAKRKADEEAAARPAPDTSPKVKGEQVDLFNTQGSVFDAPTPAPLTKFQSLVAQKRKEKSDRDAKADALKTERKAKYDALVAKRNAASEKESPAIPTNQQNAVDTSTRQTDIVQQADAIEPAKIEDFGEKIGGARKDKAVPLGPRAKLSKNEDDRPAWARKYHIFQIQPMPGRINQSNVGRWEIMEDSGAIKGAVRRAFSKTFDTEKEALDALPMLVASKKHSVYSYKSDGNELFGIFRNITDRKRAMVQGGFESREAAASALEKNPAAIIEHKFEFPERPWLDKIERIGNTRLNGDVTTKMFQDTFGFRGGEFGNWNMGGDGQAALNHAYEGLLDLAEALDVPPKALSLNGELAIAFGARGTGGVNSASAHYEPGSVVINLTKIKGAGSLAHEWWHAVDHYFARSSGRADSHSVVSEGHGYKHTARPELVDAIKNVVDTINNSERSTTTDATLIRNNAEKRITSALRDLDYRLTDLRRYLSDVQYRKKKTVATTEQLAQWDALVAKLRDGDEGAEVYIENPSKLRGAFGFTIGANIRDLNTLYKSIVGSNFLKQDPQSPGRSMQWSVKAIADNKARVNVQDDVTSTSKGRSEYYIEARAIDQQRVSNYWSLPEELGARAFESYIFDKISGSGNRSDYLVYGVENRFYAAMDMKPYPEGSERQRIDEAFDNLFGTLQTKETDTGTALYNQANAGRITPSDKAIYGMAAEGKSATEILKSIASDSRNPFYRQVAKLLLKTGINPEIVVGSQSGWKMNAGDGKYSAAYNPKTNAVALFRPASSERNVIHELIHAASIKALGKRGMASMQMKALFDHVKNTGKLNGQYGMTDIDEFMAEVFSNPKFQEMLKKISAPAGSSVKTAWDWFIRTVRGILGLSPGSHDALSRALDIGVQVMRENQKINAQSGNQSLATLPKTILVNGKERPTLNADGAPIHSTAEGVRNFWKWIDGKEANNITGSAGRAKRNPVNAQYFFDGEGRPIPFYHGTNTDIETFDLDHKDRYDQGWLGRGVYLASDIEMAKSYARMKGGNKEVVMPLYTAIHNPLVVTMEQKNALRNRSKEYVDKWTKRAIEYGHDGVVMKFGDGSLEVVAFDNAAVKSADSNNGQFDGTNPNVRYNIASDWYDDNAPNSAKTFLANAFTSNSSTSWVSAFNTQYHKAQKWAAEGKPLFKKVFDLGQKFIGDTSRFGVMAQNAAPKLFHEIRSLADAKQSLKGIRSIGDLTGAMHRADIEAVASPLYEGTLYGGGNPLSGVKFSDAKLRDDYKLSDRQIKLYHEALAAVNVSMDEMAKSIIAKHAKNNEVSFDRDMSVEDMAADVIQSLEDRLQDLAEEVGPVAEEAVAAQIADLAEMDEPKEAAKLKQEFDRTKKSNALAIERIDKTIEDVKGIEEKNQRLQDSGYFPLMRFGKHTVTAKDSSGNVQFFGMYDGSALIPNSGQYQANKIASEIRAEHPEWTVSTGINNSEKYKLYAGMNMEAVQLFAEHMDAESKEPFQEFLRQATNNRSVQKRLIHRKGTPGFDRDVRRTLAQFIVSNARATSSNYHMFDMRQAAEDADKDGGDIGMEAAKLYKYVSEPAEEAQALRGYLFFNFLGGSLASAMVNLTQVPLMTFPFLSQYAKSVPLSGMLASASKLAFSDIQNMPGKLGAALRQAELDGVTAPQEIHQLTATAANNMFSGSKGVNLLLRTWGAPFAMAESFNRRVTFITAFNIADRMSKEELSATGHKSAFEFAENAVNQTQGIYNKGNRMNVGRGAVGATLMTFKQFSIMYLELLRRLPPKQQMLMIGLLMLSAGAGGLPFVEDIEDIIDTIGQWLGYSTNSKRYVRNTLSSVLGNRAADIAINGAASQMGIDLHSRFGMQNLLPGTGIMKMSSIDKGRDIEEFVGPAGAVVKNVGSAIENLATGNLGRAVSDVAPNALGNLSKGMTMVDTGYGEDAKGRRTVPTNTTEGIAKAIGFNPKSVADFGAIKRDISQDQRLIQVKREEFTSAMVDAILSGDTDARKQAMLDMMQWNRDNVPAMHVVVNQASVMARVRAARTEGASRFLKTVSKTMKNSAREELTQ